LISPRNGTEWKMKFETSLLKMKPVACFKNPGNPEKFNKEN
jgi:hypothetical protein